MLRFTSVAFLPNRPTGPIRSSSRDVNLFVCVCLCVPFPCAHWEDQTGSSRLAGSTRHQTIGRINQVADHGDGDHDEDEIPSHAVL